MDVGSEREREGQKLSGYSICIAESITIHKKYGYRQRKEIYSKRIIWKKKEFVSVYTDHFSLEIKLVGLPKRNQKVEKVTAWNLGKPGGWENYERLTNIRASDIDQLVDDDNIPIDDLVKKVDNIEKEIKFEAFGKTRINKNKVKGIQKTEDISGDDANKELIMRQSKQMEDEVIKIKSLNLGRVGNIFKMKEVITGPKKGSQVPTAI